MQFIASRLCIDEVNVHRLQRGQLRVLTAVLTSTSGVYCHMVMPCTGMYIQVPCTRSCTARYHAGCRVEAEHRPIGRDLIAQPAVYSHPCGVVVILTFYDSREYCIFGAATVPSMIRLYVKVGVTCTLSQLLMHV